MRLHPISRPITIWAVCLVVLGAGIALGQSGRKQKKTSAQPPVQGVNQPDAKVEPEPVAAPEKPKEKERGQVIMVATDMADISISNYYPDMARQGCLSELRTALSTLELREATNQNRVDAMNIAKNDDRTFVVWMQFEVDRMGGSRGGFDLRYTIFEPKTAKVLGVGSGYPQQPTVGRAPIPVGTNNPAALADWAGRDVARQVLKRLNLVP